MDYHVTRSCAIKHRYGKYAQAKRALKNTRRHATDGKTLQVYECPYCGGWHVGHKRVEPSLGEKGND